MHGSRKENMMSILSNGVCIKPSVREQRFSLVFPTFGFVLLSSFVRKRR
jgi:hypothetical protein